MPPSDRNRYLQAPLWLAGLVLLMLPGAVGAADSSHAQVDLTEHWAAIVALAVFVFAYMFVIAEEAIHLRKSKPVIVAAGLIWVLVAIAYTSIGVTTTPLRWPCGTIYSNLPSCFCFCCQQ